MNDNTRDTSWRRELREKIPAARRTSIPRAVMPQLDPAYRITCNQEVNCGLSAEQAAVEASRCLDCPDPQCVTGCPVNINIPGFIKNIERGDLAAAARVIRLTSSLPAVCGRVCPQERQCESRCIYNKMHRQPVAIGYLERFTADTALAAAQAAVEDKSTLDAPSVAAGEIQPNKENTLTTSSSTTCDHQSAGHKVAAVGSGPASLAFAAEMSRLGHRVTIFEALHEIGGVLKYGIPEFRLPNSVVEAEIDSLRRQGVEMHPDCVIGKTLTCDDLLEQGFKGIFVGSGAGLPRFMGIPGENLVGVMSSNEYLTRINLMHAGQPGYATPVPVVKRVAVIGGGNTAMDSVRTARRMGATDVMLVYRRSQDEMPARREEIEHALEEGVQFLTLANPVEYLGDEKGRIKAMKIQRMALGEPDASGRRSPVPIEGAVDTIDVDLVIVSVGVSPNPLIPSSVEGLEVTQRGTIAVDADLRSSIPVIYAGGDIVRGGATVILAMGDGRHAAQSMHQALAR